MSTLTILSDADLDTVAGGNVTGGAGGAGGTAINGASVSSSGYYGTEINRSNLSVNHSIAVANGGDGGNAVVIIASRHR